MDRNQITIKIGDRQCVLRFGFKMFKNLSEIWGLNGFQACANKMSGYILPDGDFTFDAFDAIADVCESAIKANDPEQVKDFDHDACTEFLFQNPSVLGEIMQAYVASMPKQEGSGKQIPVKKLRKNQ